MDERNRNEEDRREERRARRGAYPRFGSFVTIAVAILMLFGAASRIGKLPETAALFGIDLSANERLRVEEERLRTALTLGAVPLPPEQTRAPSRGLAFDNNVLPPSRGEFDIDEMRGRNNGNGMRPPQVSMPVRDDFRHEEETPTESSGARLRPPGNDAGGNQRNAPETYVVANGDTWNRIAIKTLGDGKRWKELLNANPAAKNGLKVGMRLVVPR